MPHVPHKAAGVAIVDRVHRPGVGGVGTAHIWEAAEGGNRENKIS